MKKLFLACLAMALAAGCSTTVPVKGSSSTGRMHFFGAVSAYSNKTGTLTVLRNDGVKCNGNFDLITMFDGKGHYKGKGLFVCDDELSGPIELIGMGKYGTGTGRLGNDEFTFIFGPNVKEI